jgi:hypothetical protein
MKPANIQTCHLETQRDIRFRRAEEIRSNSQILVVIALEGIGTGFGTECEGKGRRAVGDVAVEGGGEVEF